MGTWRFERLDKQAVLDHFSELLLAREQDLLDADSNFERLLKLWEMRIAFVEKLILLDTGTFALTISFLANIGSHTKANQLSPEFMPMLYLSWACLLLAIIVGGLHNRRRIAGIENLFVINASRKREYRAEDTARRFKRTASFLNGELTTEEGEVIDMGALFVEANRVLQAEYREAIKGLRKKQNDARDVLMRQSKIAARMDFGALVLTFLALLLLACLAAQSAWVLLQR
jgi:hypothetical protein